ncbi:MAG: mechanosensitive ion channel [Sedimentisphaerales bacterium]|nr:mechanosensitive ion channel [Sedimentisphaerales bacterium]
MEYETIIYIVLTGLVGILLLWRLQDHLNKTEIKRKKHLKQIEDFEAVDTDTPLENPVKKAQEKGIQNVTARFSIIRRAVLPCIFFMVLLLISLPFLSRLPATIISLIIAVTTVIAGIAARPYIENLISGIVITLSRLIRIGDTVLIDNNYGTVEDISITHTTIKIWDWRRYIIPNSSLLNKEFINYSVIDNYRWVSIEFWVDYNADLELVKKLAVTAAEKSPNFANYEPPRFWIMDMTKEAIKCLVAAWADSPSQAWLLSSDTRSELIQSLKAHGIKTHTYLYHRTAPGKGPDDLGIKPIKFKE